MCIQNAGVGNDTIPHTSWTGFTNVTRPNGTVYYTHPMLVTLDLLASFPLPFPPPHTHWFHKLRHSYGLNCKVLKERNYRWVTFPAKRPSHEPYDFTQIISTSKASLVFRLVLYIFVLYMNKIRECTHQCDDPAFWGPAPTSMPGPTLPSQQIPPSLSPSLSSPLCSILWATLWEIRK